MKCPRCLAPVSHEDWQCGRCGVDLSDITPEPTGEDSHLEAAYEDRFDYPEDDL